MLAHAFSFAQILGYIAFVLGVGSFMQKKDRNLKILMAAECLTLALHFHLLGNPTAMASTLVSATRSVLALKTRAMWLALTIVAINIGLAVLFAKQATDILPLLASCIGTMALFRLSGIRMRLAMLVGTLLWLVNNILTGSIGGTALEVVVATVNVITILRMVRDERRVVKAHAP